MLMMPVCGKGNGSYILIWFRSKEKFIEIFPIINIISTHTAVGLVGSHKTRK